MLNNNTVYPLDGGNCFFAIVYEYQSPAFYAVGRSYNHEESCGWKFHISVKEVERAWPILVEILLKSELIIGFKVRYLRQEEGNDESGLAVRWPGRDIAVYLSADHLNLTDQYSYEKELALLQLFSNIEKMLKRYDIQSYDSVAAADKALPGSDYLSYRCDELIVDGERRYISQSEAIEIARKIGTESYNPNNSPDPLRRLMDVDFSNPESRLSELYLRIGGGPTQTVSTVPSHTPGYNANIHSDAMNELYQSVLNLLDLSSTVSAVSLSDDSDTPLSNSADTSLQPEHG